MGKVVPMNPNLNKEINEYFTSFNSAFEHDLPISLIKQLRDEVQRLEIKLIEFGKPSCKMCVHQTFNCGKLECRKNAPIGINKSFFTTTPQWPEMNAED